MTVRELIARLTSEFPDEYEVVIEYPDKDIFEVRAEGVLEGTVDGKPVCVITTESA